MNSVRVVFFGSSDDSLLVLTKLHAAIPVSAVVTQPAKPVGRAQTLTQTPVAAWAQVHEIPILSFPADTKNPSLYEHEQTVIDTLSALKADLFVSASYGQKIPSPSLSSLPFGGLNVHPSILPRWRGADPVPWAIASGDQQTGVTVVTLSENFDEGRIIEQKKIPILPTDTTDPLRARLFSLGASLLVDALPTYLSDKHKGTPQQKKEPGTYARRLTRQDGFEPWETLLAAREHEKEAVRIDRKFRAFFPWPGLWTYMEPQKKRLKILGCRLTGGKLEIQDVQLEGKNPVSWKQFTDAYLSS